MKKSKSLDSNSIDDFVHRKLKSSGLDLSAEADLTTLIRRVTLDLNGLPPTPEESKTFFEDAKTRGIDAAYQQVVDRLLKSPAYGERMALAWLGLA